MKRAGACVFSLSVMASMSGCGVATISTPVAAGVATTGSVHGGQQAISGAQVYLYAVSTTGGGTAQSLIGTPGFVLTDASGNFTIPSASYNCPTGAYVYLLALNGNPGLVNTPNTDIALAAGLGPCASLASGAKVTINEVTTVAFAYAVASFATSDTQIGSSGNLATPFAYVSTVVDLASGNALASHGNVVVPQTALNSLANSVAACVNSKVTDSQCTTLTNASNASPANTFQAALNIAKSPSANVGAIFGLSTPNAVFQPTLNTAPANWLLPVTDGSGNTVADGNTYTFATALGNICVELRPDVAPMTVANFVYYVNNGAYAVTSGAYPFIHRSSPGFVIQGGGYKFDGTNVTSPNTAAAVTNEYSLPNTRGTLAMAKLGNDPNSATDQWFFNTADNSTTLNASNDGGFTVFGSIVGVSGITAGGCSSASAGLAVMDAINALPTINTSSTFSQLPVVNYTSGGVTLSNLVTNTVANGVPQ